MIVEQFCYCVIGCCCCCGICPLRWLLSSSLPFIVVTGWLPATLPFPPHTHLLPASSYSPPQLPGDLDPTGSFPIYSFYIGPGRQTVQFAGLFTGWLVPLYGSHGWTVCCCWTFPHGPLYTVGWLGLHVWFPHLPPPPHYTHSYPVIIPPLLPGYFGNISSPGPIFPFLFVLVDIPVIYLCPTVTPHYTQLHTHVLYYTDTPHLCLVPHPFPLGCGHDYLPVPHLPFP